MIQLFAFLVFGGGGGGGSPRFRVGGGKGGCPGGDENYESYRNYRNYKNYETPRITKITHIAKITQISRKLQKLWKFSRNYRRNFWNCSSFKQKIKLQKRSFPTPDCQKVFPCSATLTCYPGRRKLWFWYSWTPKTGTRVHSPKPPFYKPPFYRTLDALCLLHKSVVWQSLFKPPLKLEQDDLTHFPWGGLRKGSRQKKTSHGVGYSPFPRPPTSTEVWECSNDQLAILRCHNTWAFF